MSKRSKDSSSAGFCAGLVSHQADSLSIKSEQFAKVFDRRGRAIRGLWMRSGNYYARLNLSNDDGSIRDRRVRLVSKTLSDARKEMSQLRSKPVKAIEQKPRIPDFGTFTQTYLSTMEHQKRPHTIKSEKMFIRRWSERIGDRPINKVTTADVFSFRTSLLSKGLSGRTVNLAVTVLNNVLNHAQDLGLIDSMPTKKLKPIRWKPKKRKLFTVDDINRLCSAAVESGRNGQMLSDYIRLMSCSGSRRDETLRIKWDDIDWEQQQLWVGADGLAKNYESRVVEFNPALEDHLKNMMGRRDVSSAYLFPSPRRKKEDFPARNLKESLRKIRDQVGCQGFGFHDCRHHFISYAVMSGIDYLTIARWVGHKDGGILIGKVYGHLNDDHKRKQARRLSFT